MTSCTWDADGFPWENDSGGHVSEPINQQEAKELLTCKGALGELFVG